MLAIFRLRSRPSAAWNSDTHTDGPSNLNVAVGSQPKMRDPLTVYAGLQHVGQAPDHGLETHHTSRGDRGISCTCGLRRRDTTHTGHA